MHVPVLKEEVLELLGLKKGYKVIDATLGLGGHSEEILKAIGETGHLYAFEQDERNLKVAQERLGPYQNQITYFHTNFVSLKTCLMDHGVSSVDAVLFDLGLSSPHVDNPERGFSFKKSGPLDMRYDQRQRLAASEIVNSWSENDLVEIFSKYGEERASKKVAREIISRRKEKPFDDTLELATFIGLVKRGIPEKKDPATNVFQAIRIAVNDEIAVLTDALNQAFEVLVSGGRMAVISYHSLEDRITKNIFRDYSKDIEDPNEPFINKILRLKMGMLITKKPVSPSDKEILENPRSRSAKLRVIEKL
ncbi:MAG: hypothetical protein UV80_C0003G0015 [Candidatus Peregrinibacteria bacterium GW2011_GWF2_43_17]|nr:MAG: hypothetical protein UV80_C0003G0015 [Candidatus Peregrinibacteria bacterium GW2011_GWF2_43_17]KKT19342.1 MAG: Ribosomal RNA small subunit methyltransferase H [Candidatus Peregrinibacteria bacterium GW2011_GWA2_43_8]HAU40152.1 16S rRNA (cytosine(1402)-N(4))-methyltransferase [Candidatus Peregrinibacteria bacterium]